MPLVLKSQIMATLGQDLKRERELRGVSLEEIANSTKISLRLLEALEQDRLEELPGEFFIKAILRAYANSIGLEENTVLNKYYMDSLLKGESLDEKTQGKKIKQPIPRKLKKKIGFSVLATVSLIILIFVYLISWGKKTPLPQEELKASELIKREAPANLPEIEPFSQYVYEEKKLMLEITFLEETWLQVYADGELKIEEVKRPGERIAVEASEELLVHLGNAGGVTYMLNGREGKPLGVPGVPVRNIRITLENFEDFLFQESDTIGVPGPGS
ncbi:DUF4115 domain-containing protein [bacterium]|nr:DUF4115 domain-containing protein [bacterium]